MDSHSILGVLASETACCVVDADAVPALREQAMDLLVAARFCSTDLAAWPADDRVTLEARRRQAMALDLLEGRLLGELLDGLSAADVPCLLLKGAATSRTLYTDSWCRLRSDIDVFVPPGALEAAVRAVGTLGWCATVEPADAEASGQRHFTHGTAPAPPLDLHTRLLAPVLPRAPTFDDVWHARRPVPGFARAAWTLSDPDALWYGCVHLALHHPGEPRALWLFDLDRLARSLDESGWIAVAARARDTRSEGICAAALERAQGHFATPVPADLLASWKTSRDEQSSRFLAASSELHIQWLNLRALETWHARVRLIRAHLFPNADYMRQRYRIHSAVGLPFAYVRRAVSGAVRWLRDARLGRR